MKKFILSLVMLFTMIGLFAQSVVCNTFFPNTGNYSRFSASFDITNVVSTTLIRKVSILKPNGQLYYTNSVPASNGTYSSLNWGPSCGGYRSAGVWTFKVEITKSNGVVLSTSTKNYNVSLPAEIGADPLCPPNGGQRLAAPSITAPNTFEAYPNPASDKIQLQFETDSKAEVKLMDMFGKTVFSAIMTEETQKAIDIQAISDGIYILQVCENGNVQTRKIQVKH
jgi:hypothetical protein